MENEVAIIETRAIQLAEKIEILVYLDLLCKEKNDALVELTLPEDANIYAQQYALCLPDKELLQQKLREWIDEYRKDKVQ